MKLKEAEVDDVVTFTARVVEQTNNGRTVLELQGVGKSHTWHAPSTADVALVWRDQPVVP